MPCIPAVVRFPAFRKPIPTRLSALLASTMFLASSLPLHAQIFNFSINPASSGLDGSLAIKVPTSGTLIGNWDPVTTPGGTRTKPGAFGSFGATENLPVPVTVGLGAAAPLNTSTSGHFQLTLDPAGGSVQMAGYATNFLHSGNVGLPLTLDLLFNTFRTRVPTSTYIGGLPLSIPLGEATLTQLSLVQVGGGPGTLQQISPTLFEFTVTPIVELTAGFTSMGQPFLVPGVPTPFPLAGTITVTGTTAFLTSVRPFSFDEQQIVNQPLPQLPFEMPTILPPGETSHLLMDLTVGTITAALSGIGTTNATGVLVPTPGAWAVLILGGLPLARRRR